MDKLDTFNKKLWQEQLNAMAKGFRLEERKNLFVVTIFGIAGYGSVSSDPNHFYYLYYLVPMVTVGFDDLMLSQKYAVRRIGYFLKLNSNYELEKNWELFVEKKREKRLRLGAETFTLLSFLASIWLIVEIHYEGKFNNVPIVSYLWFIILFGFGFYSKFRCEHLLKELNVPYKS